MFEKEAENYADEQIGCGDGYYEWTDVKHAFKDGAEFGYKLAHEEMDYLNKHWENGKDTDLAIDKPVYAIHLSNIREV